MTKQFAILDEREIWHRPACETARKFGYEARRIFHGGEMPEGAIGFIRAHAEPSVLMKNQLDFKVMKSRGTVIQDAAQVEVYENKVEQYRRWGDLMPGTCVFTDKEAAMEATPFFAYPIVSKANEGASSVNVRVLNSEAELRQHISDVFAGRVMVNPCSGGKKFPQIGYILLQQFIPHKITWRVNAIGNNRAVFKRFCYRHKPVAQTGNVQPVMRVDDFVERLLVYADSVLATIGSRWCALDILHNEQTNQLRLLETSLAWPWPSPGTCMSAPLFKPDRTWERTWADMWVSMFEQLEEGVWARHE